MKKFFAVILSLSITLTPLISFSGCSDVNNNTVKMGEWLSNIADFFGMQSYTNDKPYFAKVKTSDEYFADFQMAAEWGILDSNDETTSEKAVTWSDALVTLVNAGDFVNEDATKDEKIEFAISNFDTSIRDYWMDRNIDSENALLLLTKAQDLWANKKYTNNVENKKYKDNVIEIKDSTGYSIYDNKIKVSNTTKESLDIIKKDNILAIPSSDNNFEKQYYKIENVEETEDGLLADVTDDVELQDVYESLYLEETVIPTADNTVIYDGNGNLIHAGNNITNTANKNVSDASVSSLQCNTANAASGIKNCDSSFSNKFTVDGCEIGLSYTMNGSLNLGVSVKTPNLLSADKPGELKLSEEFKVSDLSVTQKYDFGFLSLKEAQLKVDYKTEQKIGAAFSGKSKYVAAPKYSNGNGKFLTNFKRAILKSESEKGAKTIASKKTIKVCSLNIYSVAVAKICLDVNVTLSAEGSFTLTLTESGSKGVEYKNGNIRYIKTCNKGLDAQIKAKAELALGFGPALYVIGLKKRLVGVEAQIGVGASVSLKGHLADSQMHLIEEEDFNDTDFDAISCSTSAFANITANEADIKAIAEAQGGIFKSDTGAEVKLHIDLCMDVNAYGIVRISVTDESYLTDILGDKVNLSYDFINEKNGKFFNMHIDGPNGLLDLSKAVVSVGSKANEDNCTLNYVPFDKKDDKNDSDNSKNEESQTSGSYNTKSTNSSVNNSIVEGEKLILSTMNVNLSKGQTYAIEVQQIPKNYTINDIEFNTKDSSIVSIDKDGTLTANKEGCTIVYAKTSDGKYQAMVSVIVESSNNMDFKGLK